MCCNSLESLKAKLEAARLKQQEKYNQFIKENDQVTKEKLKKEHESGPDDKKDQKPKGESLLVDRDYFPLMGGGSGNSYRPPKKRACGGGGCG